MSSEDLWVPTLGDDVDMAVVVLGASADAVWHLPRLPLADSALHAPFASFGGGDAYDGLVEKAAVLIEHLAQNHPLPDGNKRAAFLMAARFLAANGRAWGTQDVERDATTVERIAASTTSHDEVVAWLEERSAAVS